MQVAPTQTKPPSSPSGLIVPAIKCHLVRGRSGPICCARFGLGGPLHRKHATSLPRVRASGATVGAKRGLPVLAVRLVVLRNWSASADHRPPTSQASCASERGRPSATVSRPLRSGRQCTSSKSLRNTFPVTLAPASLQNLAAAISTQKFLRPSTSTVAHEDR